MKTIYIVYNCDETTSSNITHGAFDSYDLATKFISEQLKLDNIKLDPDEFTNGSYNYYIDDTKLYEGGNIKCSV